MGKTNSNQPFEQANPVILQPVAVPNVQSTIHGVSAMDIATCDSCKVCCGDLLPLDNTLLRNGNAILHEQGDCLVYLEPNSSYLCNYFTTVCYDGCGSCVTGAVGLAVDGENFRGTLCSASLQRGQSANLGGSCLINTGNTGALTTVALRNRSKYACWFRDTGVAIVKIA